LSQFCHKGISNELSEKVSPQSGYYA
jgi:hypothetical protein